jgi:hypothetical protein
MRVSETVHSGIQVIMRVIRGSVPAGAGVIFATSNWVAIISTGRMRTGSCSGCARSAIHSQCAPWSSAIPVYPG